MRLHYINCCMITLDQEMPYVVCIPLKTKTLLLLECKLIFTGENYNKSVIKQKVLDF